MAQKRKLKNVAVSLDVHEMLRELAFKENRAVKDIVDELVRKHHKKQSKQEFKPFTRVEAA